MTKTEIPDRLAAIFAPSGEPLVYSYARFSTPEQARGDSFRRQTEAAEKWASKRGMKLDRGLAITDEGVSAYRGANALDGGLSRFLAACRRGLIEPGSYFLVESLDRISRMVPRKAQGLFNDIVDAGVTIVTLNDDQEYTSDRLDNDPTALLISLMVSWRAHEESKTKGRRLAAVWAEKRRKVSCGEIQRLTTVGPSWLVPDGEGWREDGTKADAVRRIYTMTLAGMGEHRIAKTFNEEGVPVLGRGRCWHRTTVAKILRSPAVIGTLVPGRMEYVNNHRVRRLEQPVPNSFPAVISDADWLAVRALKDGSTAAVRGRNSQKGATHLLAGLGKCPECGSAMIRVNKGSGPKGGLPKLVCAKAKAGAGCRYKSVAIALTDSAILRDWGALFADVPAGGDNSALDQAFTDLSGTIEATEDVLTDLSDLLAKAPSALTAQRIAKVETQLGLMRDELEALDERRRLIDRGLVRCRLDEFGDLVREAEETGTPLEAGRANAALKVLFAGVAVDYQTGLLRFQWRQGGETSIRYAWSD